MPAQQPVVLAVSPFGADCYGTKRSHRKDFPDGTGLAGFDATVAEGYIDLKARNKTYSASQILI